MTSRLRVIVAGLIAQYPLGGVTWDYLQYVVGLARLGHDVYYVEDTGQWPYNPVEGGLASGCAYNVDYLAKVMSRFGLEDRWAYHFAHETADASSWFGLSDQDRAAVVESADVVINVSSALHHAERYRRRSRLVLIDTDPVFTQLKLARGQSDFAAEVDAHDVHFSFGERLDDRVPATGHRWRPTRQPIVLAEWRSADTPRNVFTTVMNWTSYNPVAYGGRSYGQKDVEFARFLELPRLVAPTVLEVAIGPGKTRRTPRELLAYKGWRVVDPARVCPDLDSYRDYVQSSRAEWSVAKNGYVVGRPGWFSCRSACYLAAAKPVVVQDTGFGGVLPVGHGIVAFDTLPEAADAIRAVEANYDRHARAAREIAEAYFDSGTVLARLLDEALA